MPLNSLKKKAMLTNHTVIFGGSFDPPHSGHKAIVQWLITSLDANEVIVCPTYAHCFGKKLAPFHNRIEMCELAFTPPGLTDPALKNKIVVSTAERGLPEPNLTFNLLKWYKSEKNTHLAFVIGADNLANIDKWDKWDECTKIAKVIAIGRPGFKVKEDYTFNHEVYSVGISTISSTEVRDRMTKRLPVDGFVPKPVRDYLHNKEDLYDCWIR